MRPIVLMGAERTEQLRMPFDSKDCWFDGTAALWRDDKGRILVANHSGTATVATATREGTDQPDVHALGTLETRTSEGIDQSEASEFSTMLTETAEGTDQSEVSMFATMITKTKEGIDQTE